MMADQKKTRLIDKPCCNTIFSSRARVSASFAPCNEAICECFFVVEGCIWAREVGFSFKTLEVAKVACGLMPVEVNVEDTFWAFQVSGMSMRRLRWGIFSKICEL